MFNFYSYLLTYKFSQDHLELFFNTARGKGGWNNNPTTMQFEGAYKRSLATRLTPTLTGNVQPLDETEIPRLCNVRRYPDYDSPDIKPITTQEEEDEINEWFIQQENSSIFRENAVFYIAGFVVSSLCKIIKCEICLQALEEKPQEHDYAFNKHSRFTQLKDNGGLHKPSKSVHELCRLTESCIRQNVTVSMQCNKISLAIELAVLRNIVGMDIFPDLHEHMFDAELGIEHHRISLIKKIINLYRKVRLHKLAKDKNLELKGQAVRHKLSKLILFQGQ